MKKELKHSSYRDRKKMELMAESKKLASEYYKTITLNGKTKRE
jgi:hypothetical protein